MNQTKKYLFFILALILFVQSCAKQENVLSLEAALVFNSGDVKPVARTEFFLLDKNFEAILQEADFNSSISTSSLPEILKEKFSEMNNEDSVRTFGVAVKTTDENFAYLQPTIAKVLSITQTHIAYKTTTDFQGKAQFKEIKEGEYYLFGYTKVGKSVAVWNLKTEIKSGENSITLDQKNALTAN